MDKTILKKYFLIILLISIQLINITNAKNSKSDSKEDKELEEKEEKKDKENKEDKEDKEEKKENKDNKEDKEHKSHDDKEIPEIISNEQNNEVWSIISPRKGTEYKENDPLTVCWKRQNETASVSNLMITLNSKNESEFKDGFLLTESISPSENCETFYIQNYDEVETGPKEVVLWDLNKHLLAKSESFVIVRKKNTINFGKTSYLIIGASVVVPVILVLIFNYKKKATSIPTGSISIPNLTVNRRKTYEPPIKSYRESWIELPQVNVSLDSIKDVYDYDLLEEAEEAAKSMGLLDKIWKARKAFVPTRDDELLIRVGDELIVREIYDDLWCYGQNKTLFEEKEAKENKEIEYNNDLSIQENEELAMFGMFPSVVLPIEFKNLKVTEATIQSIREVSVATEPVHDKEQDEDVILKEDPNSVVIKIPAPPENVILPLNNLKRSTSLRSSLHRKATQCSKASSISSIPEVPSLPKQPPKLAHSSSLHE